MKILITVKDYIEEKPELFKSTAAIFQEAASRGHEVYFVKPSDFVLGSLDHNCKAIYSANMSSVGNDFGINLIKKESDLILKADLMLLRFLSDDSNSENSNAEREFLKKCRDQGNIGTIINAPESMEFVLKKNISILRDVPLPEVYNISSVPDLTYLLKEEDKVVVKSDKSFHGLGVFYVSSDGFASDTNLYLDMLKNIQNYSFFKYNNSNIEKRITFVDNKIVYTRALLKPKPWEGGVSVPLSESTYYASNNEVEIVKSIIDQTGLFIGSVDFLGNEINELNGSGIGTYWYRNGKKKYDITAELVGAIIKKAS